MVNQVHGILLSIVDALRSGEPFLPPGFFREKTLSSWAGRFCPTKDLCSLTAATTQPEFPNPSPRIPMSRCLCETWDLDCPLLLKSFRDPALGATPLASVARPAVRSPSS